jgi:anti-sigma factor RsiW
MTSENRPICEHGIPAHMLSAWRDGDLPATEATRIGVHVAECAASQARLADYDALIQAMRAQRAPVADERLWRAVHARINQTRAGTPLRTVNTPRRRLGSLAAVAAVLALTLGAAFLLSHGPRPGGATSAQATATPMPAIVNGWSQAALPAGFTLSGPSLAVAPSDGNTAYACVTAQDAQQRPKPQLSANQIWVTHNRGAHWSRLTDPPGTAANQCFLRVDALNPAIVVAWGRSIPLYSTPPVGTPPILGAQGGGGFEAITLDGGRTWDQPEGDAAPGRTYQLATAGEITYAVRCCAEALAGAESLMVSHDAMRSWTPVDAPIVAAGQGVDGFFYRPDTSELLATAFDANTLNRHLWHSANGGVSWSELPSPATGFFDVYVAQRPATGQPWRLCAETFKPAHSADADPGPPTGVVCSDDGGAHWTPRPLPNNVSDAGFTLLGISNAGNLLFQTNGSSINKLYRLPAGGDQWQAFDTTPGDHISTTYIPGPSTGVLWAIPIPPYYYTPFDPAGRIYAKDYAA